MTGPATRRRPRAGGAPRRHRARGTAFVALAVLALGLVVPTLLVTPAGAATEDEFPVDVAITAVSPEVLRPGQDLVMRATLRNTGDTELTEARAVVRISRFRVSARSALSTWSGTGPAEPAGTAAASVALAAPLAPGASAEVTVTVPAADVRLSPSPDAWGPRGLALEVTDDGRRVGLARTFALWMPGGEVSRSRLSVLVPVVGPPTDPFAEDPSAGLEELTGTGGRLDAVLAATRGHDTVSWSVDPALVVAAEQGGPEARSWVTRLAAARAGRDVLALPYLDPDLAALAHADAAELAQVAVDLAASGDGTAAVLGTLPRTDVAWPADEVPDVDTVALAARTGASAVVTGPDALQPRGVGYSPTAVGRVATPAGEVTAIVPDRTLSDLLTDPALVARTDAGPDAEDVPTPTPAVAAQRILAETAVIARERDGDVRHLLATTPRTWDPRVATADAELDALEAAPWVTLSPVSGLLGTPDPGVGREPLPASRTVPEELAPSLVTALQESRTATAELSTAVADPAALLAGFDQELLAPTSVAWRADPAGRAGVVAAVLDDGATRRAGLEVQPPGSVVNLIAESGPIPLTVVNDLTQDVVVTVRLRPRSACLVPEDEPTVTVAAGSELAVRIPVRAVASCDVQVEADLLSGAGAVVAEPATFEVRVRADWENVGTAVVAALLGVGLVIGIVRTVHRGQTARRGAKVLAGPGGEDEA